MAHELNCPSCQARLQLSHDNGEAHVHCPNCLSMVPRPAGRFLFARLIGHERSGEGLRLQLLPFGTGARQQIVNNPPWIARAARLVREL